MSPVNAETQAVLFNAVPLLILAALYLAVGAALAPAILREPRRLWGSGAAPALVFPCVGLAALVTGILVLVVREPIGGNAPISLVAILLAAIPPGLVASRWRDRRVPAADPSQPAGAGGLPRRLLVVDDPRAVATALLDHVTSRFDLDVTEMVLIEDEGRSARVIAARERGKDSERLLGARIDLLREISGVSSAVREGVPIAVYDAESSEIINRRLHELSPVKSCVFVPLVAEERAVGVLFAGVQQARLFTEEELGLMHALASDAAPALARAQSAQALADALERERLAARISLAVRSRRELDELLRVAVEETGKALGVARCYIRLGEPGEAEPVLAEWSVDGLGSLADASRLPVANLAARERRTVAVGDVLDAPELTDATLGDVRTLTTQGVRAVLATPIVAFDRLIGVLGLQRPDVTTWTASEIALAEAIAREAAIAIDTGRLLRESERRVAEQQALLKAGEALTSDLRFDVVIERLVHEMHTLLGADAADCWTLLPGSSELVCRSVLGLPSAEVGSRIPVEGRISEAISLGRPVIRRDVDATEQAAPTGSHAGFAAVMDAPILSFGEIRGVLGVYSRDAGRFDEPGLRLMEAFAGLASIALRNAETYEESTRQAQVERGFYRMAAVLTEPLSAQETLAAVAQAAAEALGGDSAAVLRSEGGELRLAGTHELSDELADHLRTNAGELAASARAGRVLASRSLREEGRFGKGLAEVAEAAGLRSLLAVPLPDPHADRLGLVLVFFRGEASFDDQQLELAGQVAGAARGALERSELFERERRSRALSQRLARAGRELAGELDPDEVLDQAVRHAVDMVGGDGASIRVLQQDEVVVAAASGPGENEAVGARAASTAWLVGDIVQTRSTRAVADVRGDARYGEADPMLSAGYAAFIGVPMNGPEESVQGILAVYSLRPREWREEEANALHALAATAAAARANAELYQGVSHEQQRSEAILANVADGIVAVDREGKVVLWNPAAERVTGVSQAEALGRTPLQVLGRPLGGGQAVVGGSRLVAIRRGGDEVWLSLSEAVMTDPAGAVAGRIYAFRDISAERSVEQMKTEFVSTVSHELRTPLTSIFGFATTLLRRDVLFGEEERETFLRYIATESERLTAIVDRLLLVAKLESGDVPVQLVETDVAAVVSEAVKTVESEGPDGHRFVLDLADEPLSAEADGDKLGQVLVHLLDNAVRYSPAGATVTVAARRRDDAVEVSVEDEGVGIPHAEQQWIFNKFYRGEAAASAVGAGATGLGLFLAEGLVKEMGGRIWVDSNEGRGSTFVLELRAAESET